MLRWPPISLVCLALLATAIGGAQSAGPAVPVAPPAHEAFDYSIEWRLINAGKAHLEWNAASAGAPTTGDVKLHVESAGLVSRVFLVNDEYTAAMKSGFCAESTLIQAQEGARHKETRVTYDDVARKAFYVEKDLNKNTTATQDVAIPNCVHDLIGGLIALRFVRLEPGQTTQIPVSDGKKFVMAKVESQRAEPLKTAFGVVNTVKYEIYLFDNVLFRRSGHLHVWITDDDRRLPIQLEVRLTFTIGTITFRLEKPVTAEALSGAK
jgi:hypothetical protein